MAGAKQHNPGVRRAGRCEAGMHAAVASLARFAPDEAEPVIGRAFARPVGFAENHEATIGPSSLETHRLGDAPR
jgi:hypothetical protein